MGFDQHEPAQRGMLRGALNVAGISIRDLWLNYFSIGGTVGEYEVEAYLQGLVSLSATQRDLLAMAANELIDDLPRAHAPYSAEFPGDPEAANGPSDSEKEAQQRRRGTDESPCSSDQ